MGTLLKFISSSSILSFIDDILSGITTALIGPLLWGLCDIFFLILDMFETLYKKFAGIEDFMIGKDTVSQDPVLYMMNTSVVQEMFFSILILSLILLIIFTIFAIVKNIYTEKPKPVGEIIRSSMKGLLMYLLVPVATVVCLLVGNIVLRAIDGATKLGGASGMSDMLFMSAAYNANRFRDDDTEYAMEQLQSMLKDGELTPVNYEANKDNERVQSYVKIMESYGVDVAKKEIKNTSLIDLEGIASAVDEAYVANVISGNKWNLFNVMQYYYIIKINLIMVWAGGAFMIFALGKITWGLVARLFKMTAYYAISPALMAMYPIDNGKAIGSWRGEMVKNGTMAYCAIGTLNVVLSILPAFSKLKLFGVGLLDGLAVLFIDIVALASAEKMISTVSSWFGTGDALAEGKATQSAAMKPVKSVAKKASGVFAGMAGGGKAAIDQLGPDASRFAKIRAGVEGAFGGAMSQTGFAKMRQDTQKQWQEAKKQGGDYYQNTKTKTWSGEDKMKNDVLRDDNGEIVRDARGRKVKYSYNAADVYNAQTAVNKEKKKIKQQLDNLMELRSKAIRDGDRELAESYRKMIQESMSKANFIQPLFEGRDLEMQARQKQLEKGDSKLAVVNQYKDYRENDANLMKMLINQTGASGSNIKKYWDEIKQGNFSHVDKGYRDKVSKAYQTMSSDIISNEHAGKSAVEGIQNLKQSGQLGDLLKGLVDNDGKVIGSDSAVIDAIKKAQEDRNEAWEKYKTDQDTLLHDKIDAYNKQTKQELEKIGRNSSK